MDVAIVEKEAELFNKMAELLKVMANPNRIAIVRLLSQKGSLCVSQICRDLNMKQATVSIYLSRMSRAGILKCQRQGKEVFYFVCEEGILKILQCLSSCVNCVDRGGD